ncbi:MAG: AAA family ATPase [Victivallaceae bacterium]|jgi:predicted ATPase
MIQLQSLHIKTRFKNLENFFINFERSKGITLLIGNNGSGKSNIIEALSSVFAGLYNNAFNPDFSYEIKYLKDDAPITINYDHSKPKNKYIYSVTNPSDYLPSQIISVYSGEELRLWNRYYFQFYDDFMKAVISNKKPFSEKQRMEFINKYHWNLALLTMVISDLDVSDIIGSKKIETIVLEYKKNNLDNLSDYTPNKVINFAKLLYSISAEDKKYKDIRTVSLTELKSKIQDTHTEFFKLFSIALLPKEKNWKLINKLAVIFDNGISAEELSEGEKKQILLKFITRIFADNNSILLFDEPDSHIHLHNKEKIKKLLIDQADNNKPYAQSILTTHSPTLTHCFENDNVYMLLGIGDRVEIQDKTKQEIVTHLTSEFWNLQEQNIFHSTPNPIILLVEGKHDKEHINNAFDKLKDEYPDLKFDIFDMAGASNIPQLITGLRTSDIKFNKLFIGVFDNDGEGIDNCNQTKVSYETKKSLNKFQKEGFFAIKYENDKAIESGDGFTVENMFEPIHFEKSFKEALETYNGKFENQYIDNISKEIKEKAKSKLADKSKTFEKEDFKKFRNLFDLIREIKNKFDTLIKSQPPVSSTTASIEQPKTDSEDSSKFKESQKANKTLFTDLVAEKDIVKRDDRITTEENPDEHVYQPNLDDFDVDFTLLNLFEEFDNIRDIDQELLECKLTDAGYDVVRYENDEPNIVVDPNQDYIPSRISGGRRNKYLSTITKNAKTPEEKERILFGFNNAGNLNIKKDWNGTPEKVGEGLMLKALDEEYEKALLKRKAEIRSDVEEIIKSLIKEVKK